MIVGQVWAWRSTARHRLEPVQLTDVTAIRARGAIVGGDRNDLVDDLASAFWCPWDELLDYIETRIEVGVMLRAAQEGVRTEPLADMPPAVVRTLGDPSARIAYSLEDAAAECGVSTDFLRDFVKRNDLVAHYANNRVILLADDLRAWIESLPAERT